MNLERFKRIQEMSKEAMTPIQQGLAGLGKAIAAPVATALAFEGIDVLRSKLTSGRNFRKMIANNPELKSEDPKKVKMAFNTIQRLNPGYAADPGISGAYAKLVAPAGGTSTPELATQLLSGRRTARDMYAVKPDWKAAQAFMGEGKRDKSDKDEQGNQHGSPEYKGIHSVDFSKVNPLDLARVQAQGQAQGIERERLVEKQRKTNKYLANKK